MAASFPIRAVLTLRDLFTGQLSGVMRKAERRAQGTFSRIGGFAGKALRRVGTGAALGIGAGLAQAGARVLDFERKLEDVRVQMGRTRPEADSLRDSIKGISKETGVSRATILNGAEAIANLQGNTSELNKKLDVLARATVASRAPVAELAATWDSLDKAFFRGQGSAKDMEDALDAAIQAGKDGSVPLSQMGVLLGRVATQFDDVSFSGKKGIADMVAALQVVKGRGFGEAAEAATGMNSAIKQLIARAKPLKKLGVDVFDVKDGKRSLKDLRTILDQFQAKGLEDPLKLQEALKDSRAIKFIGALLDKDVRQKWDEIADSSANASATQDDFVDKQDSNSARMSRALNQVKNSLDDAFTVERIEVLTTALTSTVSVLDDIASGAGAASRGIGELAGNFAVFFGLAGRKEELGTPEAVQKDLEKREGLAADRAEAVQKGILRGTKINAGAIREAAKEVGGRENLEKLTPFAAEFQGLSPETALIGRLLDQPGLAEGEATAPDIRGLSPEAAQGQEAFALELNAARINQAGETAAVISEGFRAIAEVNAQNEAARLASAQESARALSSAAQELLVSVGVFGDTTKTDRAAKDAAKLDDVAKNAPSTGARQ